MCSKNEKNIEDECDLPDIRAKFPNGHCSMEQMIKCHGHKFAQEKNHEKSNNP
jgi:hypothetical protein